MPGRRALDRNGCSATSRWAVVLAVLADPEILEDELQEPVEAEHGVHDHGDGGLRSRRWSSVCSSVVLPVPTSPVRTVKPVLSRTPYSSWASASRWPGVRNRNRGSGVVLNGFSRSP